MTRLDELVSVAGGVAVVLVPVRRYPTRTDRPTDRPTAGDVPVRAGRQHPPQTSQPPAGEPT